MIPGGNTILIRVFSGNLSPVPNLVHSRNFSALFKVSGVKTKVCHCHNRKYTGVPDAVTVEYRHGTAVISVPLPSRHEKCSFTLRPLLSNVGQLLSDLKAEDKGIDQATIHANDGTRLASSTQVEHLLKGSFQLKINDVLYTVDPPPLETVPPGNIDQLDDVKHMVTQLYSSLHIDQYCLRQQQSVLERLEGLKAQIEPLEKVKEELENRANSRTNLLMWGGLAYMAAQFGILARLTWWEYSWDIMEPVTYFVTYGTAMAMYGYFLLTKQEYIYPDARDRQKLRFFHKAANNSSFDIRQYNSLNDQILQAEQDLLRLQDPLRAQMPIRPLRSDDNARST